MLKFLSVALLTFANCKRGERYKCASCDFTDKNDNCTDGIRSVKCQNGCFIMQNKENITVAMGCIEENVPVINDPKFNFKTRGWNHKFLTCQKSNICLLCRDKETKCNNRPRSNLAEWQRANQAQATVIKSSTTQTTMTTVSEITNLQTMNITELITVTSPTTTSLASNTSVTLPSNATQSSSYRTFKPQNISTLIILTLTHFLNHN